MGEAAQMASPPARLRRLRRGLDVLLGLLLLAAAACGLVYWYVRSPQADLDGRVALAGLQAPVQIVRDSRGIPHITAGNIHDLYLAQGFAMAQDRLWEMDLMRRLGEGRLAEVFGRAALATDRANRILGLGRTAAAEAGRLQPQEAALLNAFATGVNDYIARRGRELPLEFWLLRYRPAPWQPRDSLALAAYMYQVLASGYKDKLRRETFAAALGPELEQQLFPERSPWDVVPGAPPPPAAPGLGFGYGRGRGPGRERGAGRAGLPVYPATLAAALRGGLDSDRMRGGSNDWVLSGARSFDGQPILANDPHLRFQIPGLWWAVQLTAPGLDAAGVAITGVPGVVIGHNQHIAWGVTNTRADVQDLYREELNRQGQVMTPQGWQRLGHWHEVIRVRGGAPVAMDIAVTRHGPIVAHDAGGPLALAWTLYAPGALQAAHVFLAVDEAQNWGQFEAALEQFAGPAQNFVYADTAGHIAYQCAGWVPLRAPNPAAPDRFDGSVPVPGATATYDWHGWVPFAQLPQAVDPASGMLATANGRISHASAPHVISTDWDAPNRTRRIYQRLGELQHWNASAMGRVQQDDVSEQDRDFAQAVLAAGRAEATAGARLSATTERALALLRGFRGFMGHTSAGPTLAYQTRTEFLRRVVAAKTSDAMARQYRWDEAPVFEQWLLAAHPPQWLPAQYQGSGGGWDGLLLDSLTSVAMRTALRPAQLRWGRYETLRILHPVFSRLPVLRDFADLGPVEINGSPLTVKQARNTELGNKHDLGPSMRFVADLGDWDRSTLTLVAGESGNLFNRHYRDEFGAYLRGEGLPLWFTPAAVARHRAHRLEMVPQP
ncbi:MAG TPA: penicillin acylase family protein [Terriglobales bacterium]|nr:penicillin acylase family protein [Terriglobales bacterium]